MLDMNSQEQGSTEAAPSSDWEDQPTAIIELEGQHKPDRVSLAVLIGIMKGQRHAKGSDKTVSSLVGR